MSEQINARKPYLCIDCGAPVGRRIKRCPECHAKFLKTRPTYERTPEHRQQMSDALKGKQPRGTGWKHTPETRQRIASAWTDEMREQARQRGLEYAADAEWRLRIANALTGENNPMWQGGIANGQYAPGFSKTVKAAIRERDNFTCQLCGATEDELGYTLSIHHADYDKSNHDPSNLFATCKRCNSLVNTNRDVWIGYFVALAQTRQLGQDVSNLIGRKVIAQSKGFVSISQDGGPDLRALFAGRIPDET